MALHPRPIRLLVSSLLLLLAGCAAPESARSAWDAPRESLLSEPTLLPGDPAPPIVASSWLSGCPVDRYAPGTIYVIDHWALWSGPSLGTLSHLARLERAVEDQHPGRVRFIAVTTLDRDNTRRDVEALASRHADELPSTLAIDRDGITANGMRGASRATALPRAFVVDGDGRLAWIGHPQEVGGVIDELIAGRWDLAAARQAREVLAANTRAARLAMRDLDAARATRDREAESAALATLASLPPESIPFEPPWLFRIEYVRSLAAEGQVADTVAAAAAAVGEPTLASTPLFLAILAQAVRPASDADAEEYAGVSLLTMEAQSRADRRPSDDPWLAFVRDARKLERVPTYEALADYRLARGDRSIALAHLRMARDLADPDFPPGEKKRLEDRVKALEADSM